MLFTYKWLLRIQIMIMLYFIQQTHYRNTDMLTPVCLNMDGLSDYLITK